MTGMKIVVGVDGSAPSTRALEWCAGHAEALDAEVVAVFALDMPVYAATGFGAAPIPMPMPVPSEAERAEVHRTIEEDWCAPLSKAATPFRVEVRDGPAAAAIMAVADEVGADLVVTGRRGHGGFAELLLGSTSHQLAHHVNRPLVIIP